MNLHRESVVKRNRIPLPVPQHSRKRSLRQKKFDGLCSVIMDGHTDFHTFGKVSMTAVRYRDEVWEPYLALKETAGYDFNFMDDNTYPHRTHLDDKFLENED
ncbi:hypothetical protein AVEN_682-1 [Araneus ventricosus]|uniref:Uncharacterized protein n=1 Tax=Araneus ventricosus TaxID=182803 RepID=A0A4Y2BVG1_ARAVE|nr:hypothetical protein AVEN_682-1 [Araneus ventricosus]